AACAAVVRVLAHRHEELGRQKHVVAAAVERFADDLFGDAAGVDVGRVDEVYAAVERGVDDADGVGAIVVAPRAEHHRSQTQWADLDTGAAERTVLHVYSL